MRLSFAVAASAAFFSVASAATYNVTVGKNDTYAFVPSSISGVNVGDQINFLLHVYSSKNMVRESTFVAPCTLKKSGFDTVNMTVTARGNPAEFQLSITDKPIPQWFFGSAKCHAAGMVFAINPTADETLEAFKARALDPATGSMTSGSGTSASSTHATASPSDPKKTSEGKRRLSETSMWDSMKMAVVVGSVVSGGAMML